MGNYKQLILLERKQIQEGLDAQASIREIARSIGRSPSTVAREIKQNRTPKRISKNRIAVCKERNWCTKYGVCGVCQQQSTKCADCMLVDCRLKCRVYRRQSHCADLEKSPWVCNGCSKNAYHCRRLGRFVYSYKLADEACKTRRSQSRVGIDMSKEKASLVLPVIRDAVLRGLSPYEISVLYAEQISVHPSTVYRWIERGYGDMANIMLERKVGFKPRKHAKPRKSTSHSKHRSYECFLKQGDEINQTCTEFDSIVGKQSDTQAVLSIYLKGCHLQLYLLEETQTCSVVKNLLASLVGAMSESLKNKIFHCCLTDNGSEFEDEVGLGVILGETPSQTRLYYCDPRQSQQKGSCEKNHTEFRQILPKGMHSFDELTPKDLCVVMSHVNSNPRRSLCGLSPIEMFLAAYGQDAQDLLDTLGVELINRNKLMLKPEILDIERTKRNEPALNRLK